ncbi:unnamed protein product [Prunus armeniaca]
MSASHSDISKALTHFYPLAGRFTEGNATIECNDDGAEFVKARVTVPYQSMHIHQMFGHNSPSVPQQRSGTSACRIWCCISFPPLDFSNSSQLAPSKKFVKTQKCITRSQFSCSQTYMRGSGFSTHLEMCNGSIGINLGMSLRPSVLRHAVNLRKRVTPLLPENLAGNVVDYFTSRAEESLIDLKDLAAKIRKGSEQVKEKYATKVGFDSKETCQELKDYYRDLIDNEDIDNHNYTSWCRFTFYETDFGWGKLAWVSFASFPIKNVIILMDKRHSNGIETWLTMSKECMALFERNSELLAYASANPSVTW